VGGEGAALQGGDGLEAESAEHIGEGTIGAETPWISSRLIRERDFPIYLFVRYLLIKLLVELSCVPSGSLALSSSPRIRVASTLPSSTPH
jgi:hypothetical protein